MLLQIPWSLPLPFWLLFTSLAVMTAILQYILKLRQTSKHSCNTVLVRDLNRTQNILNGVWQKCYNCDTRTPPTILQARARSNQRLSVAFHIDNSFTTTDAQYHAEFRKLAIQRLNLSEQEWSCLGERARQSLETSWCHLETIEPASGRARVQLVPLLQATVLGTILYTMFPQSWNERLSSAEQQEALLTVAELIDSLWIASKSFQHTMTTDDQYTAEYQRLQDALQRLLPNLPSLSGSGKDNPLNLILPSYETLWRVVLMCLLEVYFRRRAKEQKFSGYRVLLTSFCNDPSSDIFKAATKTDGVTCSNIVSEIIRLYPPTKRIYRQIQLPDEPEKEEIAIDIEYMQRKSDIWGQDASIFRPGRWVGLSKESHKVQNQHFLGFGGGTTVCPAKFTFGPRVAALLTGALIEKCGELEGLVLGEGSDSDFVSDIMESDTPLRNQRGAYHGLCVEYTKGSRQVAGK